MINDPLLASSIKKYQDSFHAVVPFDVKNDRLLRLNFTATNTELTQELLQDSGGLNDYIKRKLKTADARYGIGGYAEYRSFFYSRSSVFDSAKPGEEPRRLHLGIDIWGEAGTPVFAFMGGMVHSFAFNNQFGDYGATLILLHQLDGIAFYSLYGHISLNDINDIQAGGYVTRGEEIAHFGSASENGNWPPHLHFQIINDVEMKKGDYPAQTKRPDLK
jgi:murein DD-endopeptidase MepM/ murein hydrolase activator NlpD